MNLPAGQTLQNGKYRLLQVVGQGGFGITYKGILTEVKGQLGTIRSEVPICIKEYFFKEYCYRQPDTFSIQVHTSVGHQLFDKFKEKLIKEARILSDVHHHNIVNVLDVFEENNTAYIAMEYIEGYSLKHILEKEGRLPEARTIEYVRQIVRALQFIHEKNILHLDIKPSNIIIDQSDNARLIDFGVSKRYNDEDKETSTTILTLSKGFAPIEQYDNEGTHTFSPCPDIYSLGATMYNLLTGKIPTESILRATRPFLKPTELNPALSPEIEAVIMKAMQINPIDRYQSMKEMAAALGFPPEEKHIRLTGRQETDDEDTTPIRLMSKYSSVDDDEQTIAGNRIRVSGRGWNSKNNMLVASVIVALIIISTSLFLLMGKGSAKVVSPVVIQPDPEAITMPQDSTGTKEADSLRTETLPTSPFTTQKQQAKDTEVREIDTIVSKENEEQEFKLLCASGKDKLDNGDFSGAYEDFYNALKIHQTDEVLNLITICNTKKEEKQIAEKLEQYEMKMHFGNLTVVRKKSSGKYGAIDEKGEERIPCKYKMSEAYQNGLRAFMRDDNLSDIYDSTGTLVNQNVTY
jgi:serine/threonine-protein kinase